MVLYTVQWLLKSDDLLKTIGGYTVVFLLLKRISSRVNLGVCLVEHMW